jgi:Tfp pilus assembly protein PilF
MGELLCLLAGLILAGAGCSSIRQFAPQAPSLGLAAGSDALSADQTVQACLATAEKLAAEGHAREAILLYEKARRLDPQAAPYSAALARLYDMAGDPARAQAEFTAALAAAPRDVNLLNDFGCFHDRQGNLAEAERLFRQALSLDSGYVRAQINLGVTLVRQGRVEEAFQAFAPAVGPAAAHSNVGILLAKQGRHAEARRAVELALALQPDLAQARAVQAYLDRIPAGS